MQTIILITCFSESEQQVRSSLDSVAMADYPDDKKLIFLVCDGIVTGKDNERPTAEIILGLIDLQDKSQQPKPRTYISLEEGENQINRAMVVILY